jgi:hypothetical protein
MKNLYHLLALVCLLVLPACKDMTQAKGLSETAITDFHRQFNEGKFKEVYAATHANFKKAATEAEFVELLDAMQRKLGKQVQSTGTGWRVNSINGKTTASLSQDTKFEHGKGTESFVFVISDGKCSLENYDIQSRDLIVK